MPKFKVGDVVKPVSMWDMGYHPNLIPDSEYKVLDEDDGTLTVEGKFNNLESGKGWSEDWFELAESKTTVESLRNSILDVRSKREELQKEILQLDEQEKEAIEKLKELGFVLYEGNVSKEPVIAEKKDVLYAEDLVEDMTDYRNWEVGDNILCKNWIGVGATYTTGDLCKMIGFEGGKWPKLLAPNGYSTGIALTRNFEFHSRPVK